MLKTFISSIFLLLAPTFVMGQTSSFRVMSYNVENLFDLCDDPSTGDDEFLPSGSRRWTPRRYHHKLRQIARVITAAGEWDTPALVALCEVENDTTLTHLLTRTQLRQQQYRYLVASGSDERGINVALLYQRDKFRYIGHCSVRINFSSPSVRPTRDILHVWGEIGSGDTLDVMVCHFPSKYGGEKESDAPRREAAHTLGDLCRTLDGERRNPLLIVMGDFNEEPQKCMQLLATDILFNPFASATAPAIGSHKYRGDWSRLDQIIIHRRMNSPRANMRIVDGSARVYSPDFLLTNDKTWRGKRPLRTYYGFKYEAGYSDHLPVTADFVVNNPHKHSHNK
jgi:endonuclease/exonuclease/phosphatase family metal-dependent hydrolase